MDGLGWIPDLPKHAQQLHKLPCVDWGPRSIQVQFAAYDIATNCSVACGRPAPREASKHRRGTTRIIANASREPCTNERERYDARKWGDRILAAEFVETLIVGGGQSGLAMSHMLSKRGRPHLVLERHRIAERWRSERWDSLRHLAPQWSTLLPDFPLPHDDPDGFATGQQTVSFLEAYADLIAAPVRTGVEVTALRRRGGGHGFTAETPSGVFEAKNVVVATGPFQGPVIPHLLPEELRYFPGPRQRLPQSGATAARCGSGCRRWDLRRTDRRGIAAGWPSGVPVNRTA